MVHFVGIKRRYAAKMAALVGNRSDKLVGRNSDGSFYTFAPRRAISPRCIKIGILHL